MTPTFGLVDTYVTQKRHFLGRVQTIQHNRHAFCTSFKHDTAFLLIVPTLIEPSNRGSFETYL